MAEVISKYVNLNKLGPGYTGICPFCGANGVTDFVVLIQSQKYTCSKCGATGGIFQFLLSLKGISLEEALAEVKETFNIAFDAHSLDSQWNKYLQGTDFQQVLRIESKKAASFLRTEDLEEEKEETIRRPVSYTELATFIRCPLEYKLRYQDKDKVYQPGGTRVNVGRFLHSVASQFLKQPLNERSREFIDLKFREEMAEKHNAEYVDELGRFENPTSMLLTQHFIDKPLSKKSPHFRTEFESYIILGTADCLVNSIKGIQIIEFKEQDYREFEEGVEILHYLQLMFYFFGLGGREAGIYEGAYCFFNNGNIDEIVFSEEMINQGREFIKAKLQEMTQCKEFSPKLNTLCVSCGYRDKCKLQIEAKRRV